jgi:hypothetical protein
MDNTTYTEAELQAAMAAAGEWGDYQNDMACGSLK